jgi:hypothetical protein
MTGKNKGDPNSGREPPLETSHWTEIDSETGGEIKVSLIKRGVLETESKTYKGKALQMRAEEDAKPLPPRVAFAKYADKLRQLLSDAGYPTDRQPLWIKTTEGEWRPRDPTEPPTTDLVWEVSWNKRVQMLAPPLTEASIAGELLSGLIDLLNMEGLNDDHLQQFLFVMHEYGRLQVAGPFNLSVHQALEAGKARSKGPEAIKKRADSVREIVMRHAAAFWEAHPTYVRDASNTAASIANAVNEELRLKGLLPKSKGKLSLKTIAEHVRKGFSG